MKRLWLALALLAGCSSGGNKAEDGNQSVAAPSAETGAKAPAGDIAGLTGLYEGGDTRPPNQMCIIEDGGTARFGLVVWGANLHSCSGSGTATRSGGTLTLRMAGDEACAIEATVSGGTIALPEQLAEGCAYYCGARASLGGAAFTRRGSTAADAAKATDLVGDPLCPAG